MLLYDPAELRRGILYYRLMKHIQFAAGFLFNPRTSKVLLRYIPEENIWSIFGGLKKAGETPEKALQRVILKETRIRVPLSSMEYLYKYTYEEVGGERLVFFLPTNEIQKKLDFAKKEYEWFSFEDSLKIDLSPRARQDLVFFEREMNAKRHHLPTASL